MVFGSIVIDKKYHLSGLFLICLHASAGFAVLAAEPKMNHELRESHRELMELLSPEPVINTGSDGVLTQLTEESPQKIADGRKVYHAHCAACHGIELQGQPNWDTPDATGMLPAPPHDDSGHTWHHADDQLFEIVKYGATTAMGDPEYRSMMPAFKNVLPDKDINAVLVFIRSNWSEELRQWQQGANDAQTGREWWKEKDDHESGEPGD